MNIPTDADSGDVLVVGQYVCPQCLGHIGLHIHPTDAGMVIGQCMCPREWHIPVQRLGAYFLTENQIERWDGYEPAKQDRSASDPEGKPVTVKQEMALADSSD